MKKEKLIKAVEKIEDRFISEAEVYDPDKAKKGIFPRILFVPAAAAAVVAVVIAVNNSGKGGDPSGKYEIDNYPVSGTSSVPEYISTDGDVNIITEIPYEPDLVTASEVLAETVTAEVTEITVASAETRPVTVKTEEAKTAAAPATQKTERHEQQAPEPPKKTEPPVTERQAAPEPSPVTEATTEPYSKPEPPVTERQAAPEPPPVKPAPPPAKPEPPSTTPQEQKEEPLPVTTTEIIQEAPGQKPQPLFFKNFEDISTVVWNYDLSDYPEYCHEAYTEMFERIKQNGVMYVPDVEEDGAITLSNRNIALYPYAAYEDISVGCYTEYDGSLFQVRVCYADRNTLYSAESQADYFRNRLGQEFEVSWLTGTSEGFAGIRRVCQSHQMVGRSRSNDKGTGIGF